MTNDKAAKPAIRGRMAQTDEKYTEARRHAHGELTLHARRPEDRVRVFDTTLHCVDADAAHYWLDPPESVDLAWQLARLGVDVIEAGHASNDAGSIRGLALQFANGGPAICALAGTSVELVDAAWKALEPAAHPRLHVYALAKLGARMEAQVRAAVSRAREHTDDIEFSPAPTSDLDRLAEIVQIALDEGATTINLPDPELPTRELIPALHARVPALVSATLSVECPARVAPDYALAESMDALAAGCRQVKCSMHGWTGRNPALELMAMQLHPHLSHDRPADDPLRRLWTGVDPRELVATSALVEELKSYALPPYQPIVGRNVVQPRPMAIFEEQFARADGDRELLRVLGQPIPAWLDEWPSLSERRDSADL